MTIDIIDHLVGVTSDDGIDVLRRARPDARENAQRSYDALFGDVSEEHATLPERFAVAAWTTSLTGVTAPAAWYRNELTIRDAGLATTIGDLVEGARTSGPYGSFPAGPLSSEDQDGPVWRVADHARTALGTRLTAALEHAHLLVLHPRDASPAALQALLDAGWSTTGIVTLSQLIAFVQFQIRVVAGLTVLKESQR